MMGRLASLVRDRGGSAGAEMALFLPILFALIFTMFEGGNYMWSEHKVIKGVREGARYAGRVNFGDVDCSSSTIDANAVTRIKNITRTGRLDGQAIARVPGWNNTHISVTLDCSALNTGLYGGVGAGPRILVSTVTPYPSILGLLGFDTNGLGVRAQAQSAVMGL